MIVCFRSPVSLPASPKELPARILMAKWGRNESVKGPVIVNALCNFQRQFEYPGDIRIRTYVGEVGRSSFDSFHVMTLADDPAQTPCASGGATVVWVDFPAQRSRPLPAHLRDYLARLPLA